MKKISGIVTSDPLNNQEIGATINFQTKYFYPILEKGIKPVSNWGVFSGVVLNMSFINSASGKYIVDGSAVIIAPGVALCATHVINTYLNKIKSGKLTVNCFGISENDVIIWRVKKLTPINNTDFTILSIELASKIPSNKIFYQASITTRFPKLNEQILLCGFKPKNKLNKYSKGIGSTVEQELYVSQGKVTATFPQRRDSVINPWPCFEINSLAHGGMSGGPVFDKHGKLIGLVCSSMAFQDNEGITYVSHIWPSLATEFEAVWPVGLRKSKTDLMSLKDCFIDKREAVTVTRDSEKNINLAAYEKWE